jgi:hypothetical protein
VRGAGTLLRKYFHKIHRSSTRGLPHVAGGRLKELSVSGPWTAQGNRQTRIRSDAAREGSTPTPSRRGRGPFNAMPTPRPKPARFHTLNPWANYSSLMTAHRETVASLRSQRVLGWLLFFTW